MSVMIAISKQLSSQASVTEHPMLVRMEGRLVVSLGAKPTQGLTPKCPYYLIVAATSIHCLRCNKTVLRYAYYLNTE